MGWAARDAAAPDGHTRQLRGQASERGRPGCVGRRSSRVPELDSGYIPVAYP
ncbi:MAG: hypothetical protein RLZZ282_36 [Verrucomicrobiota bacterium]